MAEFNEQEKDVEEAARESITRILVRQAEAKYPVTLRADWLRTPVGMMLAAGDDQYLYLLTYLEQTNLERKTMIIQQRLNAKLEMGASGTTQSIGEELTAYFEGKLKTFTTPLMLTGTAFQVKVWEELRRVPFGGTISYAELAQRLDKPSAFRAVAQANAQNPVSVVVPCHRIINNDGKLGGYSAGIERKQWLLNFERSVLAREAGEKEPADGDAQ